MKRPTPVEIAAAFHHVYETLAPEFGYKTRPESQTTFEELPQANRDLMIATVRAVLIERYDLLGGSHRDNELETLGLDAVRLPPGNDTEKVWMPPNGGLTELRRIVNEQAEDEGLWFMAETAPEAYLQQELRRLHAAIEHKAG